MADLDSAEHLMASFVGQEKLLVVVRLRPSEEVGLGTM